MDFRYPWCIQAGCKEPIQAKGWCNRHYYSWNKYGDPSARKQNIRNKGQVCLLEICDEKAEYKGYCSDHGRRLKNYGDPLGSYQFKHGASAYDHHGCRCDFCVSERKELTRRCKEKRYSSDPPEHGTRTSYWNWGCRCDSCKKAGTVYNRLVSGSVSEEIFNTLLQRQDNCCYICNNKFDLSNQKEIHLDHDHRCCPSKACGNCVRAVLCRDCNVGLGRFREDHQVILNACRYLENPPNISFHRRGRIIRDPDKRHRLPAIELQNKCLICRIRFDFSASRLPALDHSHNCCETRNVCGKCFRGFLCVNCNTGIGQMKENILVLKRMSEYAAAPPKFSLPALDRGVTRW